MRFFVSDEPCDGDQGAARCPKCRGTEFESCSANQESRESGRVARDRLSTRLALSRTVPPKKYWETIAEKLSAAGWTWGYCSSVTRHGWRWIVDAYRGDGRRYIVESDELLSAFLELEAILL